MKRDYPYILTILLLLLLLLIVAFQHEDWKQQRDQQWIDLIAEAECICLRHDIYEVLGLKNATGVYQFGIENTYNNT